MYPRLPDTLILGVSGKARHGKDTVARTLIEQHPALVQKFAFADGIRLLARLEYGMTTKDAPLLQRLGAEARRTDPEKWIRALYWTIAEARPAIAVISDVRHRNEAEFVKALGGFLIRVCRLTDDGELYIDPSRDAHHLSETDLDTWVGWDYTIIAKTPVQVELAARAALRRAIDVRPFYAA